VLPPPSVAIVVTFFGKAPFWMPAFLLSCGANADVQWIIYTDIDDAAGVPPNVTLKPMTVGDLNRRCSERLGTTINIQRRKLCDLKPTYGVIFEEDLRPFDFWGCSDIDIVWGNIRHFATDARLRAHDIFSSRKDKLSGHCTFYRNVPEINTLFERIPDVRALLATSHHEHLGERELTKCVRPLDSLRSRGAGSRVYWDEELATNAAYQKGLGDASLTWRNGRTFGPDGRELMYIHFHKLKQEMKTIDFGATDTPISFRINHNGFFTAG
jgi:hypothetical protein